MLATAGDGDAAYGIVVGTGIGAELNTDYALGAKIASGLRARIHVSEKLCVAEQN